MIIQIISWQYDDRSASGIVGTYADKAYAEEQFNLLQEHGDIAKKFSIEGYSVNTTTKETP